MLVAPAGAGGKIMGEDVETLRVELELSPVAELVVLKELVEEVILVESKNT